MFKPFKTNAPEVEWNATTAHEDRANRRRAMRNLIEKHRAPEVRRNRLVQLLRDMLWID